MRRGAPVTSAQARVGAVVAELQRALARILGTERDVPLFHHGGPNETWVVAQLGRWSCNLGKQLAAAEATRARIDRRIASLRAAVDRVDQAAMRVAEIAAEVEAADSEATPSA
jgi:hypothetical protein